MKTVLITGATSGIGLACVDKFSRAGFKIIAVGRSQLELKKLPTQIPKLNKKNFVPIKIDLATKKWFSKLDDILVKEGIQVIDALVNSAGVAYKSSIQSTSIAEWEEVMSVNVSAPFFLIQQILPRLRLSEYASIVNISSIAGRSKSISLGCHYTTSKAALVGMTRHLAAELSMFSIRVNCTAPSQTYSPMLDSALSAEQQVILASKNPMKRLAYASEQADVIYYLCCPESSYINGAVIDVNGGVL